MKTFIGLGPNPNEGELDIPLGFGMELFQNAQAYEYFSSLGKEQRNSIIMSIQNAQTGEEAKDRIRKAIDGLKAGNTNFLS